KVRDSFYSTLPFLVRVEWHDQDGMVQRDRWDSVVQLTADEPGITFTPDTITLSNGIGCALVKVSRPEHEVTLRVSGAGKTVTRTLRDMSGDPRMDAGGLLQGD